MKYLLSVVFCSFLFSCLPSDGTDSTEPSVDEAASTKPTVLVSVTGRMTYEDRTYSSSGFLTSNMPEKPVRHLPVELLDSEGVTIASTHLSDEGMYSFSDIPAGDYVLRVLAKFEHSLGNEVAVYDSFGQGYAIEQLVTLSEDETTADITATFDDRVAQIFNLLDVMDVALNFVDYLELNDAELDDLSVFWQWGQIDNTYTCRTTSSICNLGAGIYVLSDPYVTGDTDVFDDDVLLHEFAHYLETSWQMHDSPGGAHSLTNSSIDLRLAWSEGMASAFALSVKKWLRGSDPDRLSMPNNIGENYTNYYVDTITTTTLISVDLLAAASAYYQFSSNEAAVASVLLRTQNFIGIKDNWSILFNSLKDNTTADTVEAFWDALVGTRQPDTTELSNWVSSWATKNIEYSLDGFEQDDSVNSARPLPLDTPETHILYRNYYSNDEDWFALSLVAGQSYDIETFDLKNGADTQLELFDASYNSVVLNDDAFDCESLPSNCSPLHDGANFSSKITYVPSQSETFFLKVSTAPSVLTDVTNYGYLGRYGTYSIQLKTTP